jgi:hypothetical protein
MPMMPSCIVRLLKIDGFVETKKKRSLMTKTGNDEARNVVLVVFLQERQNFRTGFCQNDPVVNNALREPASQNSPTWHSNSIYPFMDGGRQDLFSTGVLGWPWLAASWREGIFQERGRGASGENRHAASFPRRTVQLTVW